MNLLKIIMNRRSIRKFKNARVENEKINLLLKAAMYAPSAVNKQPWHFIVIDDRTTMNKIMEIHPSSRMLETASHVIVVCGDEELQHGPGYWIADCGAATQNILLAATTMGLGSCWVGSYPRENRMTAFKELFDLPAHINVFALVAIGYTDERKEMPARYKPERIHHNRWGNSY
jgi:nitroreductase